MARGKTSKGKVYKGDISCINCPCGWEVTFKMSDYARLQRLYKRAQANHIKICPQVVKFNDNMEAPACSSTPNGIHGIMNEMKGENIKVIVEEAIRKTANQ